MPTRAIPVFRGGMNGNGKLLTASRLLRGRSFLTPLRSNITDGENRYFYYCTVPGEWITLLLRSYLFCMGKYFDMLMEDVRMRMECIGKIFSHVFQRCILGYKLLALCWSDGRSQFVVDFSIHGERGKVDGKEQGLTARQRERRYNRKRDRDCQTEKRKEEYFVSKLERLKSMVKRPLEDCSPIYMKAYTSSPSWKRSGQSLLM